MTFAMRQSVMTARASKSASAPNSLSSMPNARLIIPLQNVPSKRRRLRQHQFARFMRRRAYVPSGTGVQFFFNETKSKDEVSRFWLWDSHRENPVGDVEKRLPYLPQDRRSRSDPYLGIPPR